MGSPPFVVVFRWALLVLSLVLVLTEVAILAVSGWFEWSIRTRLFLWAPGSEWHDISVERTSLGAAVFTWAVVHLLALVGLLVAIVGRRSRAWWLMLAGVQFVDAGLAVFQGIQQQADYGETNVQAWILAGIPIAVLAFLSAAATMAKPDGNLHTTRRTRAPAPGAALPAESRS